MVTKKINSEQKLNQIISLPQLNKEYYQNFIQRAKDIQNQMNDKSFRITVVGEFSSGKSTFLNALIGKDILPHSVNETTATVTYIKNVKSNDPLCNKVIVEFFGDKESIVLDMPKDSKGLTEYVTTMAKQLNVVQDVTSVTLHVDFPYTDEPIVFIDTPGLNGVAEGHYERTRYEIQRAHTSIYLLHTRGLSQSNVQMYELLKQYQSSFVFVINAVDTLKEAEGETVDLKIAELRKQLADIGVQNDPTIIGVSSLLALTAKDPAITQLYEGDTNAMTYERRQLLLKKSNFGQVETEIWNRLTNSEKGRLMQKNIEQKVHALIEDIKTEFEEQVEIHQVEIDGKQLQEIELRMQLANQSKDDNFNHLRNFTVARKADIRAMLLERVQKDLTYIYKKMQANVESEIARYMKMQDNPEKYLAKLQEHIEKAIHGEERTLSDEYMRILTVFLTDLYESAVLRIENHYPKISISKKDIQFSIVLEKSNSDNVSALKKIEQTEKMLKQLRNEECSVLEIHSDVEQQYNYARQGVTSLQKNKISLLNQSQREIQSLGRRPDVERSTEYYEDEKGGFFGWAARKTGLGGYDTKSRPVTDDSNRQSWDHKEQQIRDEYRLKENDLMRTINAAQQRLQKCETSALETNTRLTQLERKIESLHADLNSLQREKKEIYDRNKRLYYTRQEKEILYALEQYLMNDLTKFYRQEIEAILNKEIPKVDEGIEKHYVQSYKEYTEKLQRLKKQVVQKATPQQLLEAQKNLQQIAKTLA
ncbi:dynamin family protein [Planococcus sp. ISL-109]|uniref:dynamin family protein n=1 Tax=Planococcus sp. ISL-109 TaxID=2819166 RepID=UPI001BE88BAE|nr:dynamin family protein [Planococcus sp. ISL-109]MBT2581216.1 dynamin family protein [Planococcus sp. ISL-109]